MLRALRREHEAEVAARLETQHRPGRVSLPKGTVPASDVLERRIEFDLAETSELKGRLKGAVYDRRSLTRYEGTAIC